MKIHPYVYAGLRLGLNNVAPHHAKQMIIDAVLNVYSVEFAAIDNRNRKREVKEVRQVIMYFLAKFTKLTLMDIAKCFTERFDHSTVIHNRDAVSDWLTTDDELYEKYLKICERLKVSGYIKRR